MNSVEKFIAQPVNWNFTRKTLIVQIAKLESLHIYYIADDFLWSQSNEASFFTFLASQINMIWKTFIRFKFNFCDICTKQKLFKMASGFAK